MYPSIFNLFPVIQAVKSKVRNFSTFFAHFGLHWVRPWDYRGKCHMDRKRIQCLSNASQHVPIYLQPFLRYSEISVASDWFLRASAMLKHVIDIGWTFVRLFVRLSVCPSHAGIVSKRLNILSCFLRRTIFQGHDIIQRQITRKWYKIEL